MINNVVLVGRLTKNPELRYSNSNTSMVYFTIAVNRTFADQNGERNADFISCVVFGKHAENMVRYLSKGSLMGVTGRIQTRNYQGKDGRMVYSTEVVAENIQFLESKSSANRNQDNGFNSITFNNDVPDNRYNQSNNFSQNNNSFSSDLFEKNSRYSDFGQDFPSNLDEGDFFGDMNNPFINSDDE